MSLLWWVCEMVVDECLWFGFFCVCLGLDSFCVIYGLCMKLLVIV